MPPSEEHGAQEPTQPNRPKWGRQERAFLPAALEVLETPANPAGRAIALTLTAFFLLAVVWVSFGRIDITAVATGRIVTEGGVKLVQPLDAGIVRAIHVRDGQQVVRGDILIELDPTESSVDKDQLMRERMEAGVEVARLEAMIRAMRGDEPSFAPPKSANPALVEIHRGRLGADLDAFEAEMAALESELARRAAERVAVEAEIGKLNETLPLIAEREESLAGLLKKGIAPKPKWLEVRTLLIETRQDVSVQRSRLLEIDAGIQSAAKEKERKAADLLRQLYADLQEAGKTLAQSDLALRKALSRERRQTLVAPATGTVQQLEVHTVGGVVSPAEPLMTVVPDDAELIVEAKVLNKDKGFVRPGQAAEIKLDAFPFTKYGTIPGTVRTLSGDAIEDENLGPVYHMTVALSRNSIRADGEDVTLTPGMSASVEVKTGDRRIIEFLLSPLLRVKDEALRER